ncbi:phage head-tail connector protein [Levyella massiliensis]|uniref:phage head-tail connector protein n=1 Tax=Levyella massiliensis TaxID=938289 RepID=UPI003EBD6599
MSAVEKATRLIFYDVEANDGQKNLLHEIGGLVTARLLSRLEAGGVKNLAAVPDALEYIAVELIVRRFNRIGSEGMASESVEGHSATYQENDLQDFEPAIATWIDDQVDIDGKRGVVRFL